MTALLTEVQLHRNVPQRSNLCGQVYQAQRVEVVGTYHGRVFEAMLGPKAEVAHLSDGQDLHSKASLIWAVLRCHRIMQQFVKVKFWGHPAIVKEITLFMLKEQVDPSEIGTMVEQVRKAGAKASQALKMALALKNGVGVLKRSSYDNLMNEVKQLRKQRLTDGDLGSVRWQRSL
jgi:hypothetical protein